MKSNKKRYNRIVENHAGLVKVLVQKRLGKVNGITLLEYTCLMEDGSTQMLYQAKTSDGYWSDIYSGSPDRAEKARSKDEEWDGKVSFVNRSGRVMQRTEIPAGLLGEARDDNQD